MKKMAVFAVFMFGLVVNPAFSAVVGEKVEYARGKTFHLEFRVVEHSPEAEKILSSRLGINPKTGEEYKAPMSAGYSLSKAARVGRDVGFIPCDRKVDVKVEGLGNASLAQEKFLVLDLRNRLLGEIGATRASAGSVEFEGVTVKNGALSVVLPYRFAAGQPPIVTVTPRGWKASGPFVTGGQYRYNVAHRAFDNEGKGVDVGVIIPMLAAPGACSS
jgi:hypothetical protein